MFVWLIIRQENVPSLNYDAVFEDGEPNYILKKGSFYFIRTYFRWLSYYYLTGRQSSSHFDYNTFSHCRLYSIPTSGNIFLSILLLVRIGLNQPPFEQSNVYEIRESLRYTL